MVSPSSRAKSRQKKQGLVFHRSRTSLHEARELVTCISVDLQASSFNAEDLRRVRDRLRLGAAMFHGMYTAQLEAENHAASLRDVLLSIEISMHLAEGASIQKASTLSGLQSESVKKRARRVQELFCTRLYQLKVLPRPRLAGFSLLEGPLLSDKQRLFLQDALICLKGEYDLLLKGKPEADAITLSWARFNQPQQAPMERIAVLV